MDEKIEQKFRVLENEIDALNRRVRRLEEIITPEIPPDDLQRFRQDYIMVHQPK